MSFYGATVAQSTSERLALAQMTTRIKTRPTLFPRLTKPGGSP
jgi:hypothetical protein